MLIWQVQHWMRHDPIFGPLKAEARPQQPFARPLARPPSPRRTRVEIREDSLPEVPVSGGIFARLYSPKGASGFFREIIDGYQREPKTA